MDIINKNTFEIMKSVSECPTGYLPYKWKEVINGEGIIQTLSTPECDQKYWKTVGSEIIEMSQAEKDVVYDTALELAKTNKKAEIDNKTNLLISNGFEYDSHIFSLSGNARDNWVDMKTFKDNTTFYPVDPIPITCQDETEYLMLKSNVDEFFQLGRSVVKGYVDSGRELKKQVDAAETIEAVNTIQDTRT